MGSGAVAMKTVLDSQSWTNMVLGVKGVNVYIGPRTGRLGSVKYGVILIDDDEDDVTYQAVDGTIIARIQEIDVEIWCRNETQRQAILDDIEAKLLAASENYTLSQTPQRKAEKNKFEVKMSYTRLLTT